MDIHTLPDAHLRIFERPPVPAPERIRDIYLIGICGTGMGSLAGLFRQAGFGVRGADANVYPPMSTRLAAEGIPVYEGFDPAEAPGAPDLVVVGNACTPTHPEAAHAREHGLVQQSFPEALAHFFLQSRRPLVVAGTHGKTTTTGLLVHLLQAAGLDPGFLVGGVMQGAETSHGVGSGPHFVVEGDEYDSAYFDKRPKFLHYRPAGAIVTSMELDHTDIYAGWDAYRRAFEAFAGLVPAAGTLVLCGDHDAVRALAAHTPARTVTYGLHHPENHITARRIASTPEGQSFTLVHDGRDVVDLFVPVHGEHNLSNVLAACALAMAEGVAPDVLASALPAYRGMRRRQEVLGEVGGVLVIDDFAHHPTAVHETLKAIRAAHPTRRIVAVFEPRSNTSRRKDLQEVYVDAFAPADVVFLSTPPFRHNDDPANFMDAGRLVEDIAARGIPASAFSGADALLPHLAGDLRAGDAVVIMSNGGFGGLHAKLMAKLDAASHSERHGAPSMPTASGETRHR